MNKQPNIPLLNGTIRFEQVTGVGTMSMDFVPNQRVYTLIGENGVGKTKFLECLFAVLLLSNEHIINLKNAFFKKTLIPFNSITINNITFSFDETDKSDEYYFPRNIDHYHLTSLKYKTPVIYLSAPNRGNIPEEKNRTNISKLGDSQSRNKGYLSSLAGCFNHHPENLKSLNMDTNLEEWIIQRAQSSNRFQAKEDNREIEIITLLNLLNKLDSRIDPEFLEISGDNRVFIKVENQKRELSELSSGFISILKMLQAIIAGYSYFTNEVQVANVRGIVLIDEIESHLHNEWQVRIIPLLKEIFSNTTFVVTTHSSLVISQLTEGEAYRLQRGDDGVVYGKAIANPSKIPFIDLMQTAFDVDLNQLKIDRAMQSDQTQAKNALLALVEKELAELEKLGN